MKTWELLLIQCALWRPCWFKWTFVPGGGQPCCFSRLYFVLQEDLARHPPQPKTITGMIWWMSTSRKGSELQCLVDWKGYRPEVHSSVLQSFTSDSSLHCFGCSHSNCLFSVLHPFPDSKISNYKWPLSRNTKSTHHWLSAVSNHLQNVLKSLPTSPTCLPRCWWWLCLHSGKTSGVNVFSLLVRH